MAATRFDPAGPAEAASLGRRPTSRSPTGRRCSAAMGERPVSDRRTTSTPPTRAARSAAIEALGAGVETREQRWRRPDGARSRASACAARAGSARDRRRQRRHADPADLAAGWRARRAATYVLDGDDSIRRAADGPDRRAAADDGRRDRHRRAAAGRRCGSTGAPLRGIDYQMPVASAQVKSACCSPACSPRADDRSPSPRRPATTPSGCCARPGSTVAAEAAHRAADRAPPPKR